MHNTNCLLSISLDCMMYFLINFFIYFKNIKK